MKHTHEENYTLPGNNINKTISNNDKKNNQRYEKETKNSLKEDEETERFGKTIILCTLVCWFFLVLSIL